MTKYLSLALFLLFSLQLSGQSISGPAAVSHYSIAKKQLLVQSTAKFINLINQNEIDRDSATWMACRISGIPFLMAYADDADSGNDSIGAGLIDSGNIFGAIRLTKKLAGDQRLRLTTQLAKWYLHKARRTKSDLDSANGFIQDAMSQSAYRGSAIWRYECLFLQAEYDRQTGNEPQCANILHQIITSGQRDHNLRASANAWYELGIAHARPDSLDFTYLNNAMALFQQLQCKEKEIGVLWEIADYHYHPDKKQFINDLNRILEIQRSIGYLHALYAEYWLSTVYFLNSDATNAFQYVNAALENMKWSGMSALKATFYMKVGNVYEWFYNDDQALNWYKKGLEGRTRETQLFWFKSFLYAVGQLFIRKHFEEALSLTLSISAEFPPITPWQKAQFLTTTGGCYAAIGNYKLADRYYKAFYQLMRESPDLFHYGEFSTDYRDITTFYLAHGNLKTARLFFGLVMSVRDVSLGQRSQIAQLSYKLDSAAGNYHAAFLNYQKFKSFYDSVRDLQQRVKFDELTIKYGAQQKDNDIKILQKDKKLQATELRQANNARNWTLGGVALLLIIVGLLIHNARLKQRAARRLEAQRLEIARQNNSLHHLLDEKDWLVKEIHHRVKNNLQIIMSLLNSQSAYIDNEPALAAIHDSQNRVHAMSLIHQKLYGSENISSIDLSLYIRELVSYLADSYKTGQRIRFEFAIAPLDIDASQAVPLGLILNEAITNSVKYAFPDGRAGSIHISLLSVGAGHYLLTISDNGIGLPAKFTGKKPGSLGMSLMAGLTEDLNGDFSIENGHGTTVKIAFEYAQVH